MLGRDLARLAADSVALARLELDITDADAVTAAVRSAAPDVVVNCAAYTNVDGAEEHAQLARTVNGGAVGNVAAAAAAIGAWTIHISSDYVFDGRKREPYVESDQPAPLSAYGASKLSGERAVAAAAPGRFTIVRSSWLFGVQGSCFPATILRLARDRGELTVVDDQVGTPTFTGHLAQALVQIASERPAGILHVAGDGACSWFEFAREIVRAAKLSCEVKPGRTEDLARPATRPSYSVLGSERGAPRLPGWREGLADYLDAAKVSI